MPSDCFVSLFSGAGGLDIGMEMAGWNAAYAADLDEAAIATLRKNARGRGKGFFRDAYLHQANVQSLTGDAIRERAGLARGSVPLLVGGPPCQSWSSAGHQRGFDDPRGRLFADFVRLAAELDVRWLMFENVRGLLTARGPDGKPGSALELIRRQLLTAGFQTSVNLVNAADYGVGQRRVRLIVFGYRTGDAFAFPEPTHAKEISGAGHLKPWLSLGQVLEEVGEPSADEIIRPSGLLQQQLQDLKPGTGVKSPGKPEATRPGGHWGYKQGAFVADLNKPARTVTANAQQDWVKDPKFGLRRLCPRECAAIQSFPPEWEFVGNRADQYRLIGNAVPPRLAARLGSSLLKRCKDSSARPLRSQLAPLPKPLLSAIRYTEREEARNGESRRAVQSRRAGNSKAGDYLMLVE